jgi:predicted dehydrogenase
MTEKLNIALIGCGAIARYHLDGILEGEGRVVVTAVVDAAPDKAAAFASETGATPFESIETALAEGDFDAVDIMLPHDLHEWAATVCLAAGKHVLMEKPMAPTLDACERILTKAEESGRVFMIAENAQYWPEIVRAGELINAGAIGDVITARAAFIVQFDEYWFPDRKAWRYDRDRTGGGICIDGGSHWIRPLRMWLGEIDEVVAVLGNPLEAMQGESLCRALFRHRSGVVASFDAMMIDTVLAPEPWWRVTGTKGEILIDGGFDGGLMLYDADHRDGTPIMEPAGYARSFAPEIDDFARAVLDGSKPVAPARHALGELRAALALYRSADSRNWEKVWDD